MYNSEVFQLIITAVRCNDVARLAAALARLPSPETINHDADRAFFGSTPLHEASFGGFMEMVRLLIGAGANVNVTSPSGRTPLHRAGSARRADVVRLLVQAGANVNAAVFDGNRATALHHSVYNNFPEITSLLISLGANVNATDETGMTPLHWTGATHRFEIAQILIDAGANLNVLDNRRRTPRQVAIEYGDNQVAQLLSDAARNLRPARQVQHQQNAWQQPEVVATAGGAAGDRAELQRQIEQLQADAKKNEAWWAAKQRTNRRNEIQNQELQAEVASLRALAERAETARAALERCCEELQRETIPQAESTAEQNELESLRVRNRLLSTQVTSLQQANVQAVNERVAMQRSLSLLQQELDAIRSGSN